MHLVIQEETSKGINISQLDNEKHFDLQYVHKPFLSTSLGKSNLHAHGKVCPGQHFLG